jgi:hypothetical protein
MKHTYKFYSKYATITKDLNGDKKAFEYADSLTDTAEMARVEKRIDGVWYAWDVTGNVWVRIPLTYSIVKVNGVETEISSEQKVVKSLMPPHLEIVIDKDTPISCDPSSETYWSM